MVEAQKWQECMVRVTAAYVSVDSQSSIISLVKMDDHSSVNICYKVLNTAPHQIKPTEYINITAVALQWLTVSCHLKLCYFISIRNRFPKDSISVFLSIIFICPLVKRSILTRLEVLALMRNLTRNYRPLTRD